jgi:2,4-dienoyl-CoA reductase-like NADH-dependent reductase (Old Yellow Enzyme family)
VATRHGSGSFRGRKNDATTVARRKNFRPGPSAREIARCSQRDRPRGPRQPASAQEELWQANSESKSTYDYVVQQLNPRGLAFLCVRESLDACIRSGPGLRKLFQGIFIANDGFSQKTAEEVLARGEADAVAFGRPFIANPDLPRRFALGVQLNVPDPKTFYATLRDVGYTDYPTLRTIGG